MANPLLDPHARIVIAHRGNRVAAPENTIEALRDAIALGADAVEFDVRVTRDGVPIVLHDPVLDRTTNARGLASELTFAETRALEVRSPGGDSRFREARIPSLEQVLDSIGDVPAVIEVKEASAVEPTERLIRKFGAAGRVIVGSSDAEVSERLYRSELRACASMRDAVHFIPRALLGITPLPARFAVLSVTPRYHGAPIPVIRMAVAAHKLGIPTHVWTVNDPGEARRLWAGGVAGIVTDDPGAMIRARMR